MDPRRRTAESSEISGGSGWADLPPELLEAILKLVSPRHRVTARVVCSSWRTCARASFPSDLPFDSPRLLLRRPAGDLAFFSLRRAEILPFALPTAAAARCCGHIGGWLAMAFDEDREIALWNITSGESVAIPRPPLFPVAKMLLSAPPTSPGWVVAVLGRSGTIALIQPPGGRWMTIEHGAEHGGFQDMAIWRGRLCALGCDGTVVAYRVSLSRRVAAASVLRAVQHPVGYAAAAAAGGQQRIRGRWWNYLAVDIAGELVVVRREYSVRRDAVDMEVEVVRYAAAEKKWETVEELAGQALFVGSVASMAAPATEGSGIRENCVYVARREVEMLVPHAIGVYSLADGDATGLAISGGHSVAAEPVWINPSIA
uniref:F-box domain-containing protein n=1 Tax=Leersia perrieri TaxID=77586 RepID=A0A0D9W1K3_9ORYZ